MYPQVIIQQFVFETESWSRMLVFLQQETTYFKNRLAETLQLSRNEWFLETAEKLHEEFLAQDATIHYLKEELEKQKQLLKKESFPDGGILKDLVKSQGKLRKDFRKSEESFSRIKSEFTDNLLSDPFETGSNNI